MAPVSPNGVDACWHWMAACVMVPRFVGVTVSTTAAAMPKPCCAYADRDVHLFDDLDADLALVLLDPARRRVVLYRDRSASAACVTCARATACSCRAAAVRCWRCAANACNRTTRRWRISSPLRAPPDDVAWMHGVRGAGRRPADHRRWSRAANAHCARAAVVAVALSQRRRGGRRLGDAVAQAVARAGADAATSALMLSGGIDSTLLASCLDPARSLAVSWAVPHLPDCDGSALAAATAAQLRLRHVRAPDGSHEPLSDLPSWPMEDEAPLANPYRRLNQALFAAARAEGATVLLSGQFRRSHLCRWPRLAGLVRARTRHACLRRRVGCPDGPSAVRAAA
ncbi:MAG: hypothetical protein IPP28_02420 [Xanthomonadales bacterium]|nr:hypothetical protein [Xanthomonadales bacterium]